MLEREREGPDREGRLGIQPVRGRAGGWAGVENTGPLGGDFLGYGTDRIRLGGRTDSDPFWYLQYPEQTERQVGIVVKGGGAIKCGCGGLP